MTAEDGNPAASQKAADVAEDTDIKRTGLTRIAVCDAFVHAAVLLAGDHPSARTALAKTLLEFARELDPALVEATWQ